jgi:hypothetical protein
MLKIKPEKINVVKTKRGVRFKAAFGPGAVLGGIVLILMLIQHEIKLFLNHPSYGFLLWDDALSPVEYLGGFALYLVIKPYCNKPIPNIFNVLRKKLYGDGNAMICSRHPV